MIVLYRPRRFFFSSRVNQLRTGRTSSGDSSTGPGAAAPGMLQYLVC